MAALSHRVFGIGYKKGNFIRGEMFAQLTSEKIIVGNTSSEQQTVYWLIRRLVDLIQQNIFNMFKRNFLV